MSRKKKNSRFTEFEKQVYKCVLNIPLGEMRSYKWVAERINRPKSWRAVGNVLNKNRFPLIIPCHRVVNMSGDIGGYSRGKAEKEKLINLEKYLKNMLK